MRYPLLILLRRVLVAISVQVEPARLAVFLPLINDYQSAGVRAKRGFLLGIQEKAVAYQIPRES